MVDEQTAQIETPEEFRKRRQRERTQKYRDKNRIPEPPESFQEISAKWMDNDKRLAVSNPELHARLSARHREVEELEAEVVEILKGVGIYTWPPSPMKRAETLSANTPNPDEIFPMPDDCYRDVCEDVRTFGSSNWRAVESACIRGEKLDDVEEHYRRFGFRSRLSHDTLQNTRENLVLYALRSKDSNLDAALVAEAIADVKANWVKFSPNHDELKRLISANSAK